MNMGIRNPLEIQDTGDMKPKIYPSLSLQMILELNTFKKNAEHLLNALKKIYEVEVDWTGSLYCGIELDWNYEKVG